MKNLDWNVSGGKNGRREAIVNSILANLSTEELAKVRLEECADEKTGQRYGQAACRRGKAFKVGSGGRNKNSGYAYQVWLVWA